MIIRVKTGILAREFGMQLELQVLESAHGYYIGTFDEEGPVSRESEEYWCTYEQAKQALDSGNFTQACV